VSRPRDDRGVKRRRTLADRSAQALLAGRPVAQEPELSGFVNDLIAQAVPVEPNAALAAMLEGGFAVTGSPTVTFPARPSRLRGAVSWRGALPLQLSLAGAACVAFTITAAGGDLPAPVQSTVADVVEALTPLTVPRPATPAPAPAPMLTPTTRPTPEDRPTARPTETPEGQQSEGPEVRPSEQADGHSDRQSARPTTQPQDPQQTPDSRDERARPSSPPTKADQPDPSRSAISSDEPHTEGGTSSEP
jgi:hypothetical protein